VFSWIDCTNLISSIVHIIKRVQLPTRDTSLRIEWEKVRLVMEATPSLNAKALVGGLRFLMDRLAILRVDAANLRCVIICFGCVGCTLIAFPLQSAPDWPGCKGARHRVRERQVQVQCRGRHRHPRAVEHAPRGRDAREVDLTRRAAPHRHVRPTRSRRSSRGGSRSRSRRRGPTWPLLPR
jgi:hypothetical protein